MRIRFGPFTLDLESRQLTNAGEEIHLEPKAFELLSALVLERPKALSKADLQERLWPGTFVAEANLSNLVAEIRAALGDPARAPKFVRTAHGFGYAFCGDAEPLTDPVDAAPAPRGLRIERRTRGRRTCGVTSAAIESCAMAGCRCARRWTDHDHSHRTAPRRRPRVSRWSGAVHDRPAGECVVWRSEPWWQRHGHAAGGVP